MNIDCFKEIYNESRNGANFMTRHPLSRRFIYSDGVKDLADEGCYWLLDIIGTEVIQVIGNDYDMGIVKVNVSNHQAVIVLEMADDVPPAWRREIEYTDMPAGEWMFYVQWDGENYTMILPTEY